MPRRAKEVYPSDLSDEQWHVVSPVLRRAVGHSGHVPRREVLNAIFYVLRTGCQWRYLPQSYPKWKTVYSCFRRWSRSGVWDAVVAALRVEVRYSQGRKALPTAAIIDTQSVKTSEKGGRRGYDGAKKVNGRKRIALCDTQGNFLDALTVAADATERVCALALLVQVKRLPWWKNVQMVFADSGFAGADFQAQIQQQCGVRLDIIKRDPDQKGFHVLRKRWLIEQVFGCWGRNRRLSRDYEQHPASSRATLQVASIHRFLRRLKPAPSTEPPFRYRTK